MDQEHGDLRVNLHLTKILILQKRALRFIFYAKRDKHAVPLLTDADILPLNFLYKSVFCCLMHDITNRKVPSTYRPCQG